MRVMESHYYENAKLPKSPYLSDKIQNRYMLPEYPPKPIIKDDDEEIQRP